MRELLSQERRFQAPYRARPSLGLKFPARCTARRFPGHWSRVPCKARRSQEHWSRVHRKMRPFPVPLALYKSYPARYSFRPSQLCCCRIPYRNLRNLYYLQNRCRRCHSRSYHRKHRNCCPSFHLRRYLYCNPDFVRCRSVCIFLGITAVIAIAALRIAVISASASHRAGIRAAFTVIGNRLRILCRFLHAINRTLP